MSNKEYILGANEKELNRLKIQHGVWLSEARRGWEIAEFGIDQTILDLGSGPGYCSQELAQMVGENGRVISVDKSELFIKHLDLIKQKENIPIEPILADFDMLTLDSNILNGVYCRWALAWIPNPKEILKKISDALAPKGRMVIQEYYDWSTHQTNPVMPALKRAIGASLKSFKDSDSEIDIGSYLTQYLTEIGLKIISIRLMPKLAVPGSEIWKWPVTFYESYFPRLVSMGYINDDDLEDAKKDIKKLEAISYSTICCPLMVEVIAEK